MSPEPKAAATEATKRPDIHCSFCDKPQREVRKLVAGPTAYICDECIGLCSDIMSVEFGGFRYTQADLDAAVRQEREACAQLVTRRVIRYQEIDILCTPEQERAQIAADIRARGRASEPKSAQRFAEAPRRIWAKSDEPPATMAEVAAELAFDAPTPSEASPLPRDIQAMREWATVENAGRIKAVNEIMTLLAERDAARVEVEYQKQWGERNRVGHDPLLAERDALLKERTEAKAWVQGQLEHNAAMLKTWSEACQCQAVIEAQRDEARAEVMELRRHRTKLDCRFTLGRVADVAGSHCPLNEPCVRCSHDAALEAARAEVSAGDQRLADGFDAVRFKTAAERDAALKRVAELTEAIERQKGALKIFGRANKTIAMARAPQELKEAANAARRNEAGVQEANAVLTDEVERPSAHVAPLVAALKAIMSAGHVACICWGDKMGSCLPPCAAAREALAAFGGTP